MEHMKKYWPDEILQMREAARQNRVTLTCHAEKRMVQRNLEAVDLMMVILFGRIVAGYDAGQYPGYRSPEPSRVLAAKVNGKKVVIGVGIVKSGFVITTCFEAKSDRQLAYFN